MGVPEVDEALRGAALEISLSNDLREIAVPARRIDDFCTACDLAPSIAYAVNVSLDELLTNTISYGYGDGQRHLIDITVRMDGNVIVVEMTDDGLPFDPSGAPKSDTGLALEERLVGGLGIFLVRRMMDSVGYRRCEGRNIVTLTKRATDSVDAGL